MLVFSDRREKHCSGEESERIEALSESDGRIGTEDLFKHGGVHSAKVGSKAEVTVVEVGQARIFRVHASAYTVANVCKMG